MERPVLLLADDDVLVTDVLAAELAEAGFDVVVAYGGTQALTTLDEDATRFKAVITDINLGNGADGWEVGRRAREFVPDMPVVYVSGDSGSEWSSKGVPNSKIIAKPFALPQLLTTISMLISDTDGHRMGSVPEEPEASA